jgi:hypothetical protein
VHEIKFDGYRIQMRVENGAVTLKTRKGLDWTAKFGFAIPTAASQLPNCLIDGEIVALDHRGSPDFAGLQAALSEGKTDDLIFFAFDLLFLEDEDLRAASLVDRKRALKKIIEKAYGRDQTAIRYVEHFESGGDAVLKSACRMSIEGLAAVAQSAGVELHPWNNQPGDPVLPAVSCSISIPRRKSTSTSSSTPQRKCATVYRTLASSPFARPQAAKVYMSSLRWRDPKKDTG